MARGSIREDPIEMIKVLMANNRYQDYIMKDGGHPVIELINELIKDTPEEFQMEYLQWKLGV